jgi:hypothetical protein
VPSFWDEQREDHSSGLGGNGLSAIYVMLAKRVSAVIVRFRKQMFGIGQGAEWARLFVPIVSLHKRMAMFLGHVRAARIGYFWRSLAVLAVMLPYDRQHGSFLETELKCCIFLTTHSTRWIAPSLGLRVA